MLTVLMILAEFAALWAEIQPDRVESNVQNYIVLYHRIDIF